MVQGQQTSASSGGRLYSAKEAACRLGVHVETLRRWARKGVIGHVHVGPARTVRFREADIEAAVVRDHSGHNASRTLDDK